MNLRTDATLTQTDAAVRFKGHLFASVRQLRQSLLGLATVTDANGPRGPHPPTRRFFLAARPCSHA